MRYHRPPGNSITPCYAVRPENCPFFGHDGSPDHFESETEAVRYMESVYPARVASRFSSEMRIIKSALDKIGVIYDKDALAAIRNQQELIDRLFHGSTRQYQSFRILLQRARASEGTLDKSLVEMTFKGFNVTIEGSEVSVPDNTRSEISVLLEDSIDPDSLLVRGKLKQPYSASKWLRKK